MPRVFGLLELFVRAIQTKNSLGNEALSLHSMNSILTNKTDSVENLEKQAENKASKLCEPNWV
ncbi:hypothetical protein CW749_05565 [Vibrio sp. vnigr-6D03]|uniref:hypothetical protein n=1 Tax=Vibrio sp. vnigr-6D03 TaxID=2058088 RepID=UPI000C3294A6|nr:hypothetical protein [Vibrio sp. vnigr-6D03]PKF80614.1 hypothetical protein CW749_05565 [Vibrio sp. vnigr-6D03]